MSRSGDSILYTIGHSTHSMERFVERLETHGIRAVADVRSTPYSRWQPQFNREGLRTVLSARGIVYLFPGRELGARSKDLSCYEDGRVHYRRLARTEIFQAGLQRVRDASERRKVTLLCAEKDPLECHRAILVARELVASGSKVVHILASGDVETHESAMKRLFVDLGLPEHDLFRSDAELLDHACSEQEKRIAYTDGNLTKEAQGGGK